MREFKVTTPQEYSVEEVLQVQEIFLALLKCGGLLGVKGGSTNIHFDGEGRFRHIQLDYVPFRKRKVD